MPKRNLGSGLGLAVLNQLKGSTSQTNVAVKDGNMCSECFDPFQSITCQSCQCLQ